MNKPILVALLVGSIILLAKQHESGIKGLEEEAEPIYNQPTMKTKVPANVDHNDIWFM